MAWTVKERLVLRRVYQASTAYPKIFGVDIASLRDMSDTMTEIAIARKWHPRRLYNPENLQAELKAHASYYKEIFSGFLAV
jgi:hypothetical protein